MPGGTYSPDGYRWLCFDPKFRLIFGSGRSQIIFLFFELSVQLLCVHWNAFVVHVISLFLYLLKIYICSRSFTCINWFINCLRRKCLVFIVFFFFFALSSRAWLFCLQTTTSIEKWKKKKNETKRNTEKREMKWNGKKMMYNCNVCTQSKI